MPEASRASRIGYRVNGLPIAYVKERGEATVETMAREGESGGQREERRSLFPLPTTDPNIKKKSRVSLPRVGHDLHRQRSRILRNDRALRKQRVRQGDTIP
ncbi:MAG: hypothetical protein OXF02_02060 [Simkaniaceae bacterium]|nr:hypothetical protein [Simkaniaceae bacterium]